MSKKLDIFEALGKADKGEFDFYASLSEEEKKSFSPWLFNRWMSSTKTNQEYHLLMVNELCNMDMSAISSHPELQWKLLCAVGAGRTQRHEWVKPSGKLKKDKRFLFVKQLFPHHKNDEIDTLCLLYDDQELKRIALEQGLQDKEIKEAL